jgi:hypothetical protein
LAGRLLATPSQSQHDGTPIELRSIKPPEEGRRIVSRSEGSDRRRSDFTARREQPFEELDAHGFEPRCDEGAVSTTAVPSCPGQYRLICGMNLCLLDSLLNELGDTKGASTSTQRTGTAVCAMRDRFSRRQMSSGG